MRNYIYVMLVFWAGFGLVLGAVLKPAPLKADPPKSERVTLAQIKQALAALPPMSGRFEQISWQGGRIGGAFFLALPRRAKFIYDAPAHSIITLRGNWLVVQDSAGGEANRFPIGGSPLKLLHDNATALTQKHIAAIRHMAANDGVEIELIDPSGKLVGTLALQFSLPDWQLRGWWVRDVQGLVTQTRLVRTRSHASLPERLFFIDETEAEE